MFFQSLIRKIDNAEIVSSLTTTVKSLDTVEAAFAAIKNPTLADIADLYKYRGRFYYINLSFDSAMLYTDTCLTLIETHLNNDYLVKLYPNVLLQKADVYYYRQLCNWAVYDSRNYDEAIRYYTAAKLHFPGSTADSVFLHKYYSSMYMILYSQHNYQQAVHFAVKAITNATLAFKDPFTIVDMEIWGSYNIGLDFWEAGSLDSALHYYKRMLNYVEQNEKKALTVPPGYFVSARAIVYGRMAQVLQQQKNIKDAGSLYLKCYEMTKSGRGHNFMKYFLPSFASYYLQTNQLKKAKQILEETGPLFDTSKLVDARTSFYYKVKADYYMHTNQVQAANDALLRSYQIADSLAAAEKHFMGTDITLQIENSEKTRINNELAKDNQVKQSFLLVAGGIAALAFTVLLLIWKNLNRKSAYIKKQAQLNTELYKQNEDVQQTFAALQQSHKENSSIRRTIAQDLKTPLYAILSLTYLLLKKLQSPETNESLLLIQQTCSESLALINDLSDKDLADASNEYELVDMGKMTEQCAQLFQLKADEKGQQIRLKVDHPLMKLNRQKIWRVMGNLVNNAIKFSPRGADIKIQLERKDDTVLFSVLDYGIGIPGEFSETLFDNNPVVSRTGTANEASYGMGLAISKSIIEEHAGKLWYKSESGKGSVFYVELPYY